MTSPTGGAAFRLGQGMLEINAKSDGLRESIRAQVKAAGAGQSIDIPVTADTNRLTRDIDGRLRDARGKFTKAGDESGRGFVSSASKSLSGLNLDFTPNIPVGPILAVAAAAVPASAAVLALGSSLGLAASSAAAIGPAMLGAAAGIGAVLLSFQGVTSALKAYVSMEDQAASASTSSANTQRSNARAIQTANDQLADARKRQARAVADAVDQLAAADRRVSDANERVTDSEIALTEARRKAVQQIEDLTRAARDASRDEERAALTLDQATERLAVVQSHLAAATGQYTALDLRDAQLDVAEAEDRLSDAKRNNTQAQQEANAATKAGVDGSKLVTDAEKDRQRALRELGDAQRAQAKTQRDVAEAQEDAAVAVARAVEGLSDAQNQAAQSAGAASSAASKYAAELAKLSPAGRAFLQVLIGLRDQLAETRRVAETATLPGFTQALVSAQTLLPDVNGYIAGMGSQIGRAAAELGGFAASPMFRGQLRNIMAENTAAATSFANSTVPIAGILTSVSEAAAPLVSRFAEAWENGARMVASWVDARRESGQLAAFFKAAGDELSKWWNIGKNFLVGIVSLFVAANPAGQKLSSTLENISEKFKNWATSDQTRDNIRRFFDALSKIDYQRILAIAGAVSTLAMAMRGLSLAQGAAGIVSTLGSMGPAGIAILAVAAAVAVLAAGFAYLYATSKDVRNAVKEVGNEIKEQLGPSFDRLRALIVDKILPAFESLAVGAIKEFANFLIDTLIPAIKKMYDEYLPELEKAWRTIANAFKDNKEEFSTLAGWLKEIAKFVISNLLPAMGTFAGFIIGVVAGAISGVIKTIGWFVDAIHAIGKAFSWVKDTAILVWNSITSFLGFAFNGIKTVVLTLRDTIVGAFQWIWDKVKMVFDGVVAVIGFAFDIIKQIFIIAWNWIDALTGGKLTAIKNAIASGINAAKDTISGVLETIKNAWLTAWSWIGDKLSAAWDGIKAVTGAAIDKVKNVVSSGMNSVKGFFSGMWDSVKSGWQTSINWITSKMTAFIDKIKNGFSSMKGHIVDVFKALPRAVVTSLNGLLIGINFLIKKVNGILPGSLHIPPIEGNIQVPQGFAAGGMIRGPGTGTSDSIPIMASDQEFMIRSKSTRGLIRDFGMGFLDWLNNYDVSGDPSAVRLRPRYADGGLISRTQSWISAQDPKPYVLGSNGPNAWDCSSLVGAVWALLTGRDPNRRYFTTYTLPGAGGFKPGHGTYTIGLSREHVVGNLAGLAFEAANSNDGIIVGSGATSVDRMPAQYYLPQMGDTFIGGGGGGGLSLAGLVKQIIDSALGAVRRTLPQPGGIINPIVTGLFDQTVGKLKAFEFDTGGVLPPGPSLSLNNTRRNEQVLSPDDIDRLANGGGGVTYHFEPGSITLDASKIQSFEDLVRMIEGLKVTARAAGAR